MPGYRWRLAEKRTKERQSPQSSGGYIAAKEKLPAVSTTNSLAVRLDRSGPMLQPQKKQQPMGRKMSSRRTLSDFVYTNKHTEDAKQSNPAYNSSSFQRPNPAQMQENKLSVGNLLPTKFSCSNGKNPFSGSPETNRRMSCSDLPLQKELSPPSNKLQKAIRSKSPDILGELQRSGDSNVNRLSRTDSISSSRSSALQASAPKLIRSSSFLSQTSSVMSSSGTMDSVSFNRLKRFCAYGKVEFSNEGVIYLATWKVGNLMSYLMTSSMQTQSSDSFKRDYEKMLTMCNDNLIDEGYHCIQDLINDLDMADFRADLVKYGLAKKRLLNEVLGLLEEMRAFKAINSPGSSTRSSEVESPMYMKSNDQPLRNRSTSTGTMESTGSSKSTNSGAHPATASSFSTSTRVVRNPAVYLRSPNSETDDYIEVDPVRSGSPIPFYDGSRYGSRGWRQGSFMQREFCSTPPSRPPRQYPHSDQPQSKAFAGVGTPNNQSALRSRFKEQIRNSRRAKDRLDCDFEIVGELPSTSSSSFRDRGPGIRQRPRVQTEPQTMVPMASKNSHTPPSHPVRNHQFRRYATDESENGDQSGGKCNCSSRHFYTEEQKDFGLEGAHSPPKYKKLAPQLSLNIAYNGKGNGPQDNGPSSTCSSQAGGRSHLAIDVDAINGGNQALQSSYRFSDDGKLHVGSLIIGAGGVNGAPGVSALHDEQQNTGGLLRRGSFRAKRPDERIDMQCGLRHLGKLGNGAGGTVVKEIHVPSLKIVAVKQVVINDKQQRKQMRRELDTLLYGLDHPNVVKFYDSFVNSKAGTTSLVFEFMGRGSLQDLIDKHVPVRAERLEEIALHSLRGLQYLHKLNLLHRDIKPSNLLISSYGIVKIADFGISRDLEFTDAQCNTYLGTLMYMSPERVRGEDYSYKADVWALGLLLLAVSIGSFPFASAQGGYWDLQKAIKDANFPELPHDNSAEFSEVVFACLKEDAEERFSTTQALHTECMVAIAGRVDSRIPSPSTQGRDMTERKMQELSKVVEQVKAYYRDSFAESLRAHSEETFSVRLNVKRLKELACQLELPDATVIEEMDHGLRELESELFQVSVGNR